MTVVFCQKSDGRQGDRTPTYTDEFRSQSLYKYNINTHMKTKQCLTKAEATKSIEEMKKEEKIDEKSRRKECR